MTESYLKQMQETLILKTGGTFSKVYEPLSGELIVPNCSSIVETIIETAFLGNGDISIKPIIHKDSLDFTDDDRALLVKEIMAAPQKHILITHGTDTMDLSASIITEKAPDKVVVFTGAMKPFSICPIEATSNLSLAYGFLASNPKNGIYIAMNGIVDLAENVTKDRTNGLFILKDNI